MKYYTIQVRTRSENKYIKLFKNSNPEINLSLFFPQREMITKKRGIFKKSLYAVFPGYIFIEAENDESILSNQWRFKNTEGFFRFLKSNHEITPLTGQGLDFVLRFYKRTGQVTEVSKVYFDENSRIVVKEGPLMGLEGIIKKVDRHKRRVKIIIDLYDNPFSIDLAFEVIEMAKKENNL